MRTTDSRYKMLERGPWRPTTAMTGAALLAAALFACAPAARADVAVLVGVQRYPNLPDAANQLRGCVSDAAIMEKALRRYGFRTVRLTDAQATKRAVLDEIRRQAASVRPTERFVFYFAGHGTGLPVRGLLPSDARDDSAVNHITPDELYQAVRSVPAYSRTVILDSCFSGGMARSFERFRRGRPDVRPRYYQSRRLVTDALQRSPVPASGQDAAAGGAAPPAATAAGDVCYYAAALGNETAAETPEGGKPGGVFTFYLDKRLNGKNDVWSDIHKSVKGQVAAAMADGQHPVLTSAYLQTPVFEAKKGASPIPPGKPGRNSLWDLYNEDRVDRARLSLRVEPDRTDFAPHEPFDVRVDVGGAKGGYLLLVNRAVDGNLYLMFPRPRDGGKKEHRIDDARVKPGRDVFQARFAGDRPGTDRLKAFLFREDDKKNAEKYLRLFERGGAGGAGLPIAGSKNLYEIPVAPQPFHTSEITLEIEAPDAGGGGGDVSAATDEKSGEGDTAQSSAVLTATQAEKITGSAAPVVPGDALPRAGTVLQWTHRPGALPLRVERCVFLLLYLTSYNSYLIQEPSRG